MISVNKKVIVTGCSGFIGFNLTLNLLDKGYDVIGIDRLNDAYDVNLKKFRLSKLENNKNLKYLNINLADNSSYEELKKVSEGASTVFHLAARAGVRQSFLDPASYVEDNTVTTTNIANFTKSNEIEKLIIASTSSVYGNSGDKLMSENKDEKIQPPSVYASTKLSGEILSKIMMEDSTTKLLIPRFFTVYGPYGRPDMSILRFIHWIVEGKEVLVLGDGEQMRSFTYIDDVIEALMLMLDYDKSNTFNIGSSTTVSLNKVIEIIENYSGKKAIITNRERAYKDPDVVRPNLENTYNNLKWKPSTNIETGIEKTVSWYLDNKDFLNDIVYIQEKN